MVTGSPQPNSKRLLSEIPDDIIYAILSMLPVTRAYEVCYCSRRFRDAWRFCCDLSFDKKFLERVSSDRFKAIVNEIIMSPPKRVPRRFQLCTKLTTSEDLVTTWIARAVALGVEEMQLDFTLMRHRRFLFLSEGILQSDKLRVLSLSRCDPNFTKINSLPNLQLLTLLEISLLEPMIVSILSSCPALQSWQLIRCPKYNTARFSLVDSKKLREVLFEDCIPFGAFEIIGPFLERLCFRSSNGRRDVQLKISLNDEACFWDATNDLIDVILVRHALYHFFNVRCLSILIAQLDGDYPRMSFGRIEEFHLQVHTGGSVEILYLPCFILRCPLVRRVHIELEEEVRFEYPDSREEWWGNTLGLRSGKLMHLEELVISGARADYSPHILTLVKSFLVISAHEFREVILFKAPGEEPEPGFTITSQPWRELSSSCPSINFCFGARPPPIPGSASICLFEAKLQ